jgi:hypothetical protein
MMRQLYTGNEAVNQRFDESGEIGGRALDHEKREIDRRLR